MANLSITSECNRSCAYCFAPRDTAPTRMSRPVFRRAVKMLQDSGIRQVRLLGGEPTLHPDFAWFVRHALRSGMQVLVFTNGFTPARALACLGEAPAGNVGVILNVSARGYNLSAESDGPRKCMELLQDKVTLGVNLTTVRPHLDPLLKMIERHHLRRALRLGIAHPRIEGTNRFLHPKDYAALGAHLGGFITSALHSGVIVDLDCGFVPCMFPPHVLDLDRKNKRPLGLRCGPIPDLLPDGSAVPCYPFAGITGLPLTGSSTLEGIVGAFKKEMGVIRDIGIYPQCRQCSYMERGECSMGCRAAAVRRFRSVRAAVKAATRTERSWIRGIRGSGARPREATRSSDPRGTGASRKAGWVIPYVDQPVEFWQHLHDEFGDAIDLLYCPLPGDPFGSGRPPQPSSHLRAVLRNAPFKLSMLINPVVLNASVEQIGPRIVETVRRCREEFGIVEVVVASALIARRLRDGLPGLRIAASTLSDIASSAQLPMMDGLFDVVTPSSRIMRDLKALKALRLAFHGQLRLMVNEGCLPGCLFRVQHFYEMQSGVPYPLSLCDPVLKDKPWLRLTGAWVLPQHLHLFEGVYDQLKLDGRVTLRDPEHYRRVLKAYIQRDELSVDQIGAGPACISEPMEITEEFYRTTLVCDHQCATCQFCEAYFSMSTPRHAARR